VIPYEVGTVEHVTREQFAADYMKARGD